VASYVEDALAMSVMSFGDRGRTPLPPRIDDHTVAAMTDAISPPIDSSTPIVSDTGVAQPEAAATASEETDAVLNVRYKPASLPSAPFWLILIAGVMFLAVIAATWSVVFMFAVGLALFALLLPITNWLARRGVPRGLAALLVVALMVIAAILVGVFAISVYFNQFLPFIGSIPERLTEIQAVAPDWLAGAIQGVLDSIHSSVANLDTTSIALGFLKGVLGLVGTALALTMLPFFVFYLLTDQPRMARAMHNDIPVPWRPYVKASVDIFVRDFANYFKAEVIVGLIQGTMVTIGVFIIGLIVGPPLSNYVILLGVIAGVMELLPQIGPIIALIPAMLLALATSPLAVVLVGGFYLVVFIIEANVLVPKIEGEVISFSPASVIFLVAVGLALGGIVGGILALPVAAIVRDLFGFVFRQIERESIIEERVQA
jgi:predicted PurR-regulated permease PerM